MKRKKIFSMMSVSALLFGVALVISGCNHPTGGSQGVGNNQNNNTNNTNSMEVQPTGPADPELKGTQWVNSSSANNIDFDQNVNTAFLVIAGVGQQQAIYSVKDSIVSFDLSQEVAIRESLTVDKYIQAMIPDLESSIARLKEEIAKGNNVENNETWLKNAEKELANLKNPTPEMKNLYEREVATIKEIAQKLKPHAKFTGTLNPAKTELTVDEFPVYNNTTNTFTVKKIVLQKL